MHAVCVNPELLATIAKSILIAGGKQANMVVRTNTDMLSAILITSEMAPDYQAILMPMRPMKDETIAKPVAA